MINDLVDNIKLDLNRGRIDVVKYVRIGDTRVHTLHFTLLESGKVYQLDGLLLAEVMIRKPDGNECDQTAIRKGNEIHYTLRTQDYNVLGEARCWLKLTFEDGGEITSPEFSIMVCEDGIPRVREESTNEYTALTQMLAQATQYAEAAAGSAAEAAASVGAITGDVEQAHAYAQAAAESAEEASGYQESVHQEASAAAGSAMEAQTYAGYASSHASEAAGYANTASTYASNAESYASNAQDNATAAAGSATQAEASATNASNSASSASDYATAAGNSATNASTSASAAGTSASNAASSATAASGSATAAAGSATSAEAESLEAEGWAKGTQNGIPVESTSPYYQNNSKYFADQASHASGHTVLDPSGNEMPGRPNIQFTGGVTVSDDQTNNKTVVNVNAASMTVLVYDTSTWAEAIAAVAGGEFVVCAVTPSGSSEARLAYLKRVDNQSAPTTIDFIYYNTVDNKDPGESDETIIYRITNENGGTWSTVTDDVARGVVVLTYGSSTWDDFITAYNNNAIIYCRAGYSSNPAAGNLNRRAFLAYVDREGYLTEAEFQYYRSVSSHTADQQGDQIFIYKLYKTGGWTVTVREASTKIVAGASMSSSYNNGVLTLQGRDIQKPSGTAMTKRRIVQFADNHLSDDSTNGKTVVETLKPVTSADFETETEDGFYFITDEDEQPLTADDIPYDSTHSVGDMLDMEVLNGISVVSNNATVMNSECYRIGKLFICKYLLEYNQGGEAVTIQLPVSLVHGQNLGMAINYSGWTYSTQLMCGQAVANDTTRVVITCHNTNLKYINGQIIARIA